jgi:hypothetical protein
MNINRGDLVQVNYPHSKWRGQIAEVISIHRGINVGGYDTYVSVWVKFPDGSQTGFYPSALEVIFTT